MQLLLMRLWKRAALIVPTNADSMDAGEGSLACAFGVGRQTKDRNCRSWDINRKPEPDGTKELKLVLTSLPES